MKSRIQVEVKAAATVTPKDFAGLQTQAEDTGQHFVRGVILYTGEQAVSFGERLRALPVSALWRMP